MNIFCLGSTFEDQESKIGNKLEQEQTYPTILGVWTEVYGNSKRNRQDYSRWDAFNH